MIIGASILGESTSKNVSKIFPKSSSHTTHLKGKGNIFELRPLRVEAQREKNHKKILDRMTPTPIVFVDTRHSTEQL